LLESKPMELRQTNYTNANKILSLAGSQNNSKTELDRDKN